MTIAAKVFSFCVMDDSIAPLVFDDQGRCSCCREALAKWKKNLRMNETRSITSFVDQLKEDRKTEPYDCMVGLSGGVDSAYLAHVLHVDYGLRLLAVHVDGGWNSEPAVHNIERVVRGMGIDLHTVVIEWAEMRDLQLAFLISGVLNQDMPQDHAFFSSLYRISRALKIDVFASGVNFPTKLVGQSNAGYPSIDGRHIRAIHQRHGQRRLKSFPILTVPRYLFQTRIQHRPRIIFPLNWIRYDKFEAINLLKHHYGWRDYGVKHSESLFTSFYQQIYLPIKFGHDKRRLHLSSLVVSSQITRQDALKELHRPIISEDVTRRSIRFVAKKLNISSEELERLIDKPIASHAAYAGDVTLLSYASRIKGFLSLFAP